MNVFRCTPDRSLDLEYLRICAIYKLLKIGRIGKSEAIELSHRRIRGVPKKYPGWLTPTIELWLSGPLRRGKHDAY